MQRMYGCSQVNADMNKGFPGKFRAVLPVLWVIYFNDLQATGYAGH